ncbi:aldo/keto reductase [Halopseudomonas pachastrellae]|nr:aldo/keto reductase [Halopseudomonas pachastrellae]
MREVTGKLALGTVQFGLPYGIANQQGQVSVEEVGQILERAREAGVDTLDTAIAYGESERVLGEFDLSSFKVVTKLSAIPDACDDVPAGWNANWPSRLLGSGCSAFDACVVTPSGAAAGAAG